MKTKSLFSILIIAILLTAIGTLSISTSESIFAQNNRTISSTNTGLNMPNQTTMISNSSQSMPLDMNYQNLNMGNKQTPVNGSVYVLNSMYKSIISKFKVSLDWAMKIAEKSVGNKSYVLDAITDINNGYLTYSIFLGTPDVKFYNVVIDPGNGQILSSTELSMIDGLMMMHGWDNKDNGMMKMKNGFDNNGQNNNQGRW